LVKLKIADLIIQYIGREEYLNERFYDFSYEGDEDPDMTIRIVENRPLFLERFLKKGTVIDTFSFYQRGNDLFQFYPDIIHAGIRLIDGKNKYKDTTFYVCDKFNGRFVKRFGREQYLERMKIIVFNAIQEVFYNRLLFEDAMSIHSASVIYNDRAIVFSAPSGTGKSTQANLWHKHLGCEILDGDVTVCREKEGKLYVYGLPWCGSSGMYINKEIELGAFVFLKQAKENTVKVPGIRDKISYIYSSTFSESLSDEMAQKIAQVTEKIVNTADIYEFSCNMETDAVTTLRKEIDEAFVKDTNKYKKMK
jgi:hypothetical protein